MRYKYKFLKFFALLVILAGAIPGLGQDRRAATAQAAAVPSYQYSPAPFALATEVPTPASSPTPQPPPPLPSQYFIADIRSHQQLLALDCEAAAAKDFASYFGVN